MVYGREVDGTVTTFGTTGYTYQRVFVLYDRATGSVWYPLDDGAFDAISGPRRGDRLPFLGKPPIVSLGEWRKSHPETDVLLDDASRLDNPFDPFGPGKRQAGVLSPHPVDG